MWQDLGMETAQEGSKARRGHGWKNKTKQELWGRELCWVSTWRSYRVPCKHRKEQGRTVVRVVMYRGGLLWEGS